MRLRLALALLLLPTVAHAQQVGPYFRLKLQASHTVPPTGYVSVWAKTSNKHVYRTDSAGTDTDLTDAGSGGGGGTTQTIDVIDATAATGKTITSAVADSGTNVGIIFNNSTALTGTTLLASFRNNGTQKFAIADDGSLALAGTTTGTYSLGGTPSLAATLTPTSDNSLSLGGSSARFANVYTGIVDSGASNLLLRANGNNRVTVTDTGSLTLTSGMADGASAISTIINTTTAWSNGGARLLDIQNNGTRKLSVDTAGILLFAAAGAGPCNAAGTYCLVLNAGSVGLYMPTGGGLQPEGDQINYLGNPSKRWSVAFVGDADADKPACDSTTRGAMLTVFAAGGASDTLQICMKAAADTYAYRTIYTAP